MNYINFRRACLLYWGTMGGVLNEKKINTYKNLMIRKNIPKEFPLGLKV